MKAVCCVLLALSLVSADPNFALDEPKSVDERAFMDWARNSGIQLSGIDLANFTNPVFTNYKLRGVKATQEIKPGQELLAVPGNLIMSTITALASPISSVFTENPQLFTDDQVLLAVFVMHEFGHIESSKWAYHLKISPTRFHTACEFSAVEMRRLEGSVLFDEAKARQALFTQEYQSLFPFLYQKYPHFFDSAKCTFTAYKYARLFVQTRAFGMHVDGRVIVGIVPMGDMFNHNPSSRIAWKFDHTSNVFRMYTQQGYKRGEQIFNNYGPRSNRRLLLDFGFVIEDNPFDFVEMPAPISSGNTVEKNQVMEDRGLSPSKRTFTVRLGEVPEELMFAARIARATPEEIASYRRSMELFPKAAVAKMIPNFNSSISIRNEIAALSWLQDSANTMLRKYKETYEEDVALLENQRNLDRGQTNALFVRLTEKRIYRFLADFADVHIPLLNYYNKYFTTNSLTNARLSLAGAEYMRNVLLPLHRAMLETAYKEAKQIAGEGDFLQQNQEAIATAERSANSLQPQADA